MDLSQTEIIILKYILAEKTCSEIAELMGVSKHTIMAYNASILRKLGLENSAALKNIDIDKLPLS